VKVATEGATLRFRGSRANAIVADVYGQGSPTGLFLHGGGQTRHSWRGAARCLGATSMRAVAVDQRGHGDSDWVADGAYAFADYADDVLALATEIRDRFGSGTIAVGASLGGLAALIGELNRPGALEGLVLVDVVPRMEASGVEKIQGFMGERIAEGFASLDEAADAIAAYLPHRPRPRSLEGLSKNLRLDDDGRYRWHWDPRFLSGPRPVNTGRATLADDIEARLDTLNCPVLLVRGARSELITEAAADRFLRFVPHAEYVDVSDAGHMVAGDSNDVFSRVVLDFVQRLR
jgi:pimeloyl-ACP methyl ester carboxylesterase